MAWDNGVSAPGGVSYAAPLMQFQNFSNWAADDPYKKVRDEQQKQLNQQQIAQGQRQQELAAALQGGAALTDGKFDPQKAAALLARFDPNSAANMVQQAPAQPSTMQPEGQPQGQPQGAPPGQPTSIPARPLPPPAQNSPQGDQPGSVMSRVTDTLPPNSEDLGKVALNLAKYVGADPNASLTPEQAQKADIWLKRYAQANKIAPRVANDAAGGAAAAPSFKDRFAAADGGGTMPPSANAVSPAPPPAAPAPAQAGGRLPLSQPQPGAPAQAAPVAAPQAQPPQGQPQPPQGAPIGAGSPAAAPQPAAPPQQPLRPQVPLPKGFTDPQQAILALNAEAARVARSGGRGAAEEAERLKNWATRIEASIAPVDVNPNTTRLDPRNGQVLYQGPNAALLSGGAARSETIQSDAEVYRQTGKMPAGIARTPQGQAEAHAIRNLARENEIAAGGNPAEWSTRWQKFQAQATGRRVLENRAVGLELAENEATTLIPRVREASARVSRTSYPTINSLILASQKGSGGTDVIKLGIAVESLIPVYARVLKPVGQLAQGDMARAHDILDKAWSDGQIGAALDQMGIELKSARTALDKTLDEYGVERPKASANDAAKTKTDDDGWIDKGDGVRIRKVKP